MIRIAIFFIWLAVWRGNGRKAGMRRFRRERAP